jgi:hypothetical protein
VAEAAETLDNIPAVVVAEPEPQGVILGQVRRVMEEQVLLLQCLEHLSLMLVVAVGVVLGGLKGQVGPGVVVTAH